MDLDLVYYYPTPDEAARLELQGIPVYCTACGAVLPQRRLAGEGVSRRGGGRLREFCPNPGEERSRSSTTSCRTTHSQLLAVDRYLPSLPYPDTEEGQRRRAEHEALLLSLRNLLNSTGQRRKKRAEAEKGQAKLF